MDQAAAVNRLTELELEKVDSLIDLVDEAASSELDALAGETDDGLDDYAEEAHELGALEELFSQLSAVALYAVVEIRTKAALTSRATKGEIQGAFQLKKVKELFLKYTGRTLESLPEFPSIDELRCINNCFKHSGLVNSELARYGWAVSEPLGDVRPAIKRLRPKVPGYIAALCAALRQQVSNELVTDT
jgi:hypothetical protein